MSAVIQSESTEYLYIGVTGSVPSGAVEVAFLAPTIQPTASDWKTGIKVTSAHALWSSVPDGLDGDYFVAILVGSFGGGTVTLSVGVYAVWVRLTDTAEQVVRLLPNKLEIV